MKILKSVKGTDWCLINYYAIPEEGFDLDLKFAENQNIKIVLTDVIPGLPVRGEIKIKPRLDYMMSNGDITLATKKFVITLEKSIKR